MPTYDYRCSKCRHEFEAFQSIKAKPLRRCPKCRKSALERLIGAGAGLIFRGSGFYITDYARKASAPSDSTDSTAASSGESSTQSDT